MMIGMSVQAVYMLIDTAFIGRWVGGSALAGLGLIFPPMFIIMGITFGLGSGATTVTIDISNAEWLALNGASKTLVAAPGANKAIKVTEL